MPPIERFEGKWNLPGSPGVSLRACLALLALVPALSLAATPQTSVERTAEELFKLRNHCSNAAQQAYETHWSHPPADITLLGFTNHYDVRNDRCYLLVTYRKDKATWFDASDVQTGRLAAHILVSSR
jgi:hypothetical protein